MIPWHCKRGYQTHERILQQKVDREKASIKSEIAWRVDDGTIFISEERVTFQFSEDVRLQIDFVSVLSTTQPLIKLDGDPQHADFNSEPRTRLLHPPQSKLSISDPGEGG